jgi:type II secretory pathway pseudopilin PulG
LVEVIVVIVIIAILAAIGVPALTGYIDKAQDKQWIAKARNAYIATRTVIGELYGDGRIDAKAMNEHYTLSGYGGTEECWEPILVALESDNFTSQYEIMDKISALAGDNFSYETHAKSNGLWDITLVGSSAATLLNADGFIYELYTGKTAESGEPVIVVTYKMDRYDTTDISTLKDLWTEADEATEDVYNPNAGYEVYYLVK